MSKRHIALIGASGGIGSALLAALSEDADVHIHAFSRGALPFDAANITPYHIDIVSPDSIEAAAASLPEHIALDGVLIATGFLHDEKHKPEKSMREIEAEKFEQAFRINCTAPALIARHFLPKMRTDARAVFAALSARVGSISDNRMGGWYAYRASKAALNMVIKNLAIEHGRRHKQAIIVGLHPGTVDTKLSEPFQSNVADGKLFTPKQSASYLLQVMAKLAPEDSGKCFAWDGQEILP